ncbi:dihydrodipicolinate synthase family protein [Olivibacter domesticus]|uniref:N-acetylneuraminate lyase n=1 Tax=Olivibacter domesticus TaxID=407022 RepID=A0A1H7XGW6_OLID1|nr:dihydrodipicolinate synthase family protein [Olivibacter domesticus]SEM32448.1 N-acetylneuraminate lyase [Olivibacter domesticus]
MKKTEGLIAATFSSFHEDGTLNLDIIPTVVSGLIKDGLAGIFICGTNGEGPNLTIEERMAVAEAYVGVAKGKLKIMIHVGHASIEEARKLAKHAASIGADAISSVAAFYFKPQSVTNLVDSIGAIAQAAPNIPFYYYHIPSLTGVGIDMIDFLTLAEVNIPNLAGIKYTASTIHEYQACLNYKGGKFDVLYGYDELLLPALAVGAKGAVGSTYNFAAPLYLRVMELFEECKLHDAQRVQLGLVEMIREMTKFSPIPAQKAIMEMMGISLGPTRLPLVPLETLDKEVLKTRLEKIGFFDALKQVEPVNKEV